MVHSSKRARQSQKGGRRPRPKCLPSKGISCQNRTQIRPRPPPHPLSLLAEQILSIETSFRDKFIPHRMRDATHHFLHGSGHSSLTTWSFTTISREMSNCFAPCPCGCSRLRLLVEKMRKRMYCLKAKAVQEMTRLSATLFAGCTISMYSVHILSDACMYVCVCVCMCIYIYIYICMYVYNIYIYIYIYHPIFIQ